MIPNYPEFTPITSDHKAIIQAYTARFGACSDHTFSNLISWNFQGSTKVSSLNENIVVQFSDYVDGSLSYTFIGGTNVESTVSQLLQECTAELKLVPEPVINLIDKQDLFTIKPDDTSHEYVYSVDALCGLPGGKLKNKRNRMSQFMHMYGGSVEVAHLTALTPQIRAELVEVFMIWAMETEKSVKDYALEKHAFENFLDHFDQLDKAIVTTIRVDGSLKAFSINELLESSDYAVCHFEKVLPLHCGLYPYIISEVAKELRESGCTVVNWQQDLGLPGLRKIKSTYNPLYLQRKYTIGRPLV